MAPPAAGDYDSDDLVDYEEGHDGEEEELSPEDKVAMSEGTASVQKSLGEESKKVTTKQIQDALWHYFYDIDKSVAYLRKTFIAPPSKPTPKKAPEGTSAAVSFSAVFALFEETHGADPEHMAYQGIPTNNSSFSPASNHYSDHKIPGPSCRPDFSDMPWLNIPEHRRTIFIEPAPLPGGLLGGGDGAPKMTKLQALAAARKKKTEESKEPEKLAQAVKGIRKLSISGDNASGKENQKPASNLAKRQKTTTSERSNPQAVAQVATTEEHDSEMSSNEAPSTQSANQTPQAPDDEAAVISQPFTPTAFGRTLFGSAPEISTPQRDVFAMPYSSSSSFLATAFSKPSPDDVVLEAQAKAGKKTPAPAKTAKKSGKDKDTDKDELADSISSLKVSDIPPPKSKGLDVVKEFEKSDAKKSLSFVVVGHVDAGKSTLMGRLLVELKYVEQRTVEKFRKIGEKTGKQSFAFAWVMDQRAEERDRGVTIDIATNYFETPTTKFTILDAPGHRDFVPNMIAGASQADLAILVIDANTGAYEKGLKGQTREHVLLLRSLGVQRLIVAVNKLDMVQWSQPRFDEITQQITGFLTGLGFPEKLVSFVPISGLNGDNIITNIADPAASWYTGGTLIEALEDSGPASVRALKKPFRMSISEVFRSQQGTTTLSGRLDSGTIQLGEVVFVQPSGETAYIKSINVDTDSQEWAVAGQNVSLTLTNIDPVHIRVGDILCHTTDPVASGDEFTMKAMAFEHLLPMPVDIHRGRLHAAGQIKSISATIDKTTGEVTKKRPKVVQPGDVARVKIKLASKVPLEAGQRVVIRSGGETIAAGLVE